jgi:hypothetical protein
MLKRLTLLVLISTLTILSIPISVNTKQVRLRTIKQTNLYRTYALTENTKYGVWFSGIFT